VIDTNVVISALRSRRGASHRLLLLLGSGKFETNLSVSLFLEYQDAASRLVGQVALGRREIDDILDYLCASANRRQIYYLWRPVLSDPKDELVLELAVTANCDYIVTYNVGDFAGARPFGVAVVTPKQFLQRIGELP
jgi:putative PIN family toxin of toxin-antitoxin system